MENPRNRYSMDDSPARQRYDDGEPRSSRAEREWDPPIYRRESRAYSRDSYREEPAYRSRSSYRDEPAYRSRSSYRDEPAYRSRDSYRDESSYRSRDSYRDEPACRSRDSYRDEPSYRSRSSYRDEPSYRSRNSYREEPAYRSRGSAQERARRNPPRRESAEGPRPAARPAARKRQSPLQRILSRFAPLLLIAGMLIAAVIVLIVLLSGGKEADPARDMPQATAVPTAVPTMAPAQDEFQADKEPVSPMQQAPAAPVEAPAAPMEAPVEAPGAAAQVPTAQMPTEYSVLGGIPQTDRLLGLQENPRVPDSYFDDVIFIGDSVSMKLTYFVMNERKDNPRLLGDAEFLTSANVSSRNALKEVSSTSLHPTYKGQKMTFEDAIAASGKKKVYIMLGLNDVGVSGINKSVENLMTFIKRIKDRNPDVLIFVQSATPRVTGDRPTTKELFEYNMRVYDYCLQLQDQGVYFVDVAYIFRDENGNLFPDYCSDLDSMALHFNNSACRLWIDFLYTHALV